MEGFCWGVAASKLLGPRGCEQDLQAFFFLGGGGGVQRFGFGVGRSGLPCESFAPEGLRRFTWGLCPEETLCLKNWATRPNVFLVPYPCSRGTQGYSASLDIPALVPDLTRSREPRVAQGTKPPQKPGERRVPAPREGTAGCGGRRVCQLC